MEFHHIGVATNNIKESIDLYKKLGFTIGEIMHDEIQKVNICFARRENHPDVELIEPSDYNSPVRNILEKIGTTPYHFCYSTRDIIREINDLKKMKFITVGPSVNAKAFSGRMICFCYNRNFGLIELVQI